MKALKHGGTREQLQHEIACLAARYIVEEGHDSGPARHKAATQILGTAARQGALPDHEQMETALRAYLHSNQGTAHRVLLQRRRSRALHWMQVLAPYRPHLVGAVLNGSATEHMPVHLQLFADNAKEVEMTLLDRGLDIRVAPGEPGQPHVQEVIGFLDATEAGAAATKSRAGAPGREAAAGATAMMLTVLDTGALRTAPAAHQRSQDPELHPVERAGRADAQMVEQLLADTAGPAATEAGHG